MPSGLEILIGGMFATLFGSPIMIGLFCLLIFIVIGVVFRLAFEGFFVTMFSLVILLSINGFLPLSLLYVSVIVCGFIIFMAIMRLVKR